MLTEQPRKTTTEVKSMGLIHGSDHINPSTEEELSAASDRRRRWRESRGLCTPDNPYWDVDEQCYRLEQYQDDKSVLADAYLATLPAEQPRTEGGGS